MIHTMTFRLLGPVLLSASALLLSSCGNSDDQLPLLAGNTQAASGKGEALYQKAKQADDAGKTSKAIYKLDGNDKAVLCLRPEGERPDKFEQVGEEQFVINLTRKASK